MTSLLSCFLPAGEGHVKGILGKDLKIDKKGRFPESIISPSIGVKALWMDIFFLECDR